MKRLMWICPKCGLKNRLRFWRCRRCRNRCPVQHRIDSALLWAGSLK